MLNVAMSFQLRRFLFQLYLPGKITGLQVDLRLRQNYRKRKQPWTVATGWYGSSVIFSFDTRQVVCYYYL